MPAAAARPAAVPAPGPPLAEEELEAEGAGENISAPIVNSGNGGASVYVYATKP